MAAARAGLRARREQPPGSGQNTEGAGPDTSPGAGETGK